MATDNVTLNAGTGGATIRTYADAGGNEWPAAVVVFATTIAPGANVFQEVTSAAGLPVAQQGTWTVGVSGGVAVTGTFWQATQPISGAVTANVGTTGGLALDATLTGGAQKAKLVDAGGANVASVSAAGALKVDASATTQPVSGTVTANAGTGSFTVAQATAANLNATVAQAGTWNVGTVTTVSAVTAITNALPAGTNLVGQVAAGQQVNQLYSGTTALTPKFAPITASASGPTTVIAAVASKKLRILRWSLSANGAVNVNWQSHTTTGTATGLHYMTQFASAGGSYCPVGIFDTAVGEALDLNLSAAVAVGGELTYVEV